MKLLLSGTRMHPYGRGTGADGRSGSDQPNTSKDGDRRPRNRGRRSRPFMGNNYSSDRDLLFFCYVLRTAFILRSQS